MSSTRQPSFHDALTALDRGGSPGTLAPWRRLVEGALWPPGSPTAPTSDLVDDVLSSLLLRLLQLREAHGPAWVGLLGLDEGRTIAFLRQMTRSAAADLDPGRRPKKTLSQLVARVLAGALPPRAAPPLSLQAGGRFDRALVAEAVAWALAEPDGPPRHAGALAGYLVRRYGLTTGAEEAIEQASLGPGGESFERVEHAGRVAAVLGARLAPEEQTALRLQLLGEPLDVIARNLGCKRTKAHEVARRARQEVDEVVTELEEEWRAA